MDLLLRRRMMMEIGEPLAPVFYDLLVFDGAAYIDTGTEITAPNSYCISVPLGNETEKKAQRIFTLRATNNSVAGLIISASNTTNRTLQAYNCGNNASSNLAWSYATYNFFMTPTRFGWGNSSTGLNKGNRNPSGGIVLGSNSGHSGDAYTGTMGTFCIYGGNAVNATTYNALTNYTPVITLRPCTYNGEAGMWYVEGNKFFGNSAGAGTLTVSN